MKILSFTNMKKLFALGAGIMGAFCSAHAELTNTPDAVNTKLTTLAENAISLFDVVVPVILAVVGLGVLIAFVKKIKKS